jgi:peptidyl-prolyl cis-trans isomerase SurA|tara:strand:+ start:2507 stop:3445 length:939 start_codon:yes stop_codon:yes gene_type:complete
MIKIIKTLYILFVVLLLCNTSANSLEKVFIILKINNEIVTNIDVKNEIKYLIALNPQLKTVPKNQIQEIAKKSIVKENLKKSEILKYYILDQKNPLLQEILAQFYKKLGMDNEKEFNEYLINFDLLIDDVLKKIEVETVWNQMIYQKYKAQLQINPEKLKKKISLKKDNQENNFLSLIEIVFEKKKDEKFQEKLTQIQNSIEEIGFENTANIYSVSESSKFGGKLGWVNEESLTKKVLEGINGLKIGEQTAVIDMGSSYVILKIQDIKKQIIEINEDAALKKMIKFEENKQLENFSRIYYNKVKINSQINEL